jgi:hypothetical protein
LNFLRNDPNVFLKFKPSKPLIKKMDFYIYLMGRNEKDKVLESIIFEFYSFLLRYHKNIDYQDFSENEYVL